MRIDEQTGEIISYENYYCPNCDCELPDEYDYCDRCGEYVGVIVNNYPHSGDSVKYNSENYNNIEDNDENTNHKTCGICLLLFIIFCFFSFIR